MKMWTLAMSALLVTGIVILARNSSPLQEHQTEKQEKEEECAESQICVKGPCGERPCCKPFPIELPSVLPAEFRPRVHLEISVRADGTVDDVKILDSTGIDKLDHQFVEGVRKWCFDATEQGMTVDWGYSLELR